MNVFAETMIRFDGIEINNFFNFTLLYLSGCFKNKPYATALPAISSKEDNLLPFLCGACYALAWPNTHHF
jgi:hypothetical protein